MKRRALVVGGVCLLSGPALAEPVPAGDAIHHQASVDVVAQLFRRQTFPDASGAVVRGDMAVPLYHYAMLRVQDVDAPWRDDSLDVELAGWGNLELADAGAGRVDGDIHVANVRHRLQHGFVRLGRQVRAGSAARYAHFDGVTAGAHTDFGSRPYRTQLGMDAYGGFTVLPRWNMRPGYHQLGSVADSLLRDPAALPEPAREESWLAGGRAYVSLPSQVTAGFSFHEQQSAGGLERRNAAVDLLLSPIEEVSWDGQAIVDMDAAALADLRAGMQVYPLDELSVRAGFQHLSPALLLSRQSVLSVFSTEAFDELGLEADVKPWRWLRAGGFGYAIRFDDGAWGSRAGGQLSFLGHGRVPFVATAGYRRITESINGYHALRASLSVSVMRDLRLVGDTFLYVYDEPIEGVDTSIVGVLSAAQQLEDHVEVMLASSLARTPYAEVDAQLTARVRVDFEGGAR